MLGVSNQKLLPACGLERKKEFKSVYNYIWRAALSLPHPNPEKSELFLFFTNKRRVLVAICKLSIKFHSILLFH